jgi:transcriptional regulator with XRE-family HTH domain
MRQGMSLGKLAQLAHYSKGYLSRVETGQRLATIALARSCDEALQAGGALAGLMTAGSRAGNRLNAQNVCRCAGDGGVLPHQRAPESTGVDDAGDFGAALRRARLSARLTQNELAHRSGLSTRTISDLECGRVGRPRNSSLDLLVAALGADQVDAAKLLGTTGPADDAREQPRERLHPVWELPAAAPDFTGRKDELAAMVDRAAAAANPDSAAPVVVLLTGAPGVGKTELAVRLGHDLAARSPDIPAATQLFVELGGTCRPPASAEILRQMLSSLGVSVADCPADPEQRMRLYRSLLYRRHALVLLDDAADEAQVRPLLPAGPGCVVVITSRRTLHGLSPTIRMPLDVLPPEDALVFLGQAAGQRRLAADEASARCLVAQCGQLPLALRVVANQLAARPHWPVAHFAGRLEDESARLPLLVAGDLSVLASFDRSYSQLSATAQTIFSRLALLPDVGFTTEMASVLSDSAEPAWPVLDELATASLIQATAPDRYRTHYLLRLYARRRLIERDGPERIQAVERRVGQLLAA